MRLFHCLVEFVYATKKVIFRGSPSPFPLWYYFPVAFKGFNISPVWYYGILPGSLVRKGILDPESRIY